MTDTARVGEAFIELRYQFDKLSGDLQAAGREVGRQVDQTARAASGKLQAGFGRAFQGIGRGFSSLQGQIAGLGAAAGAGTFLSGVVRTAGGFEAAMQQVAAVSGASADEIKALAEEARRLGAATKFSATEAAEAQGFLAQSGYSTQQSLAALEGVLQLASAGNIALGESADIASNILAGLGLEAEQMVYIGNILAGTSTQSTTDIRQLGEAFSYVAPIVAQTATSVEQASAAIGVLGDNNIRGSRAGTNLGGILLSLASATGPAAEALEGLGISFEQVDPEARSLSEILNVLGQAGIDAGDAARIFGRENTAAILSLVEQRGRVDELTASLEAQETTVKSVADTQNQGLNASLKAMGSAFQELQLAIAESGLLENFTALVQGLTSLVRKLSESNPAILKFAGVATALVAALAPVGVAIGIMVAAFGTVAAPVLGVAAAFVAVVAAAVAFGDDIVAAIEGPLESVKSTFAGLVELFGTVPDALAGLVSRIDGTFGGDLVAAIQTPIEAVKAAFGSLVDVAGVIVNAMAAIPGQIAGTFGGAFVAAINNPIETVKAAFTALVQTAQAAVDALLGLPDKVAGTFSDMTSRINASLSGGLSGALSSVREFVGQADDAFFSLFDNVVGNSYIPDMVDQIGQESRRLGSELVEPVERATRQADQAFSRLGESAGSIQIAALDARNLEAELGAIQDRQIVIDAVAGDAPEIEAPQPAPIEVAGFRLSQIDAPQIPAPAVEAPGPEAFRFGHIDLGAFQGQAPQLAPLRAPPIRETDGPGQNRAAIPQNISQPRDLQPVRSGDLSRSLTRLDAIPNVGLRSLETPRFQVPALPQFPALPPLEISFDASPVDELGQQLAGLHFDADLGQQAQAIAGSFVQLRDVVTSGPAEGVAQVGSTLDAASQSAEALGSELQSLDGSEPTVTPRVAPVPEVKTPHPKPVFIGTELDTKPLDALGQRLTDLKFQISLEGQTDAIKEAAQLVASSAEIKPATFDAFSPEQLTQVQEAAQAFAELRTAREQARDVEVLDQAAVSVIDGLTTETDRYIERLSELDRLLSTNRISQEQYSAAAAEAQEQLFASNQAVNAALRNSGFPDVEAAAIRYNEAVAGLKAQLDAGRISQEQFNAAMAGAQRGLDEVESRAAGALGGVRQSFQEFAASATDSFAIANQATTRVLQGFSDAVVDGAMRGELAFSDFAKSVVADLLKIVIQASIAKAVLGSLALISGGSGGGSSAGAAPSASPGGGFAAAAGAFVSSLFGFQFGGSFTVPGGGGIDSELVAFRATPGERVQITPPGKDGGTARRGGNQIVNIMPSSGMEAKTEQRTGGDGSQILDVFIVEKVNAAISKGKMDGALGQRFGARPSGAR